VTTATLTLPYGAPGLNDLNRAQRAAAHERGRQSTRRGKGRRVYDGYTAVKAQWATRIHAHVYEQRIPSFPDGAHIHFHVVECDRRRDPDGFTNAISKLALDGLVKAGVLPNDGWAHVLSLSYSWEVGKPCVKVTLTAPDEKTDV
jgi:hypothetical protein